MASQDSKLRQYLLATAVSIIMALGGCVGKDLYARVSTLESENTDRKVENATVKTELEDFRESFENFKQDVKDDIEAHHKK